MAPQLLAPWTVVSSLEESGGTDGEGRWCVAILGCYDCSWGCVRKSQLEEGLSVISTWKAVNTRSVDETPAPLAGAELGTKPCGKAHSQEQRE